MDETSRHALQEATEVMQGLAGFLRAVGRRQNGKVDPQLEKLAAQLSQLVRDVEISGPVRARDMRTEPGTETVNAARRIRLS